MAAAEARKGRAYSIVGEIKKIEKAQMRAFVKEAKQGKVSVNRVRKPITEEHKLKMQEG